MRRPTTGEYITADWVNAFYILLQTFIFRNIFVFLWIKIAIMSTIDDVSAQNENTKEKIKRRKRVTGNMSE